MLWFVVQRFSFRPNLPMIDMIHKAIRSVSVAQRDKIDFHIIFVSRKSTMCTQRLEKYNIIGEFKNILELELDLIPFDHDLLTLEHPLGFKEMCTELDDSCLYQVSRSLMSLQSYFGFFPNIIGIGPSAAKVSLFSIQVFKIVNFNQSIFNQAIPKYLPLSFPG